MKVKGGGRSKDKKEKLATEENIEERAEKRGCGNEKKKEGERRACVKGV